MSRYEFPPWCRVPETTTGGCPKLRTKHGTLKDGKAKSFALGTKAKYVFGRSEAVEIPLVSETTSRLHAAVLHNKEGECFLVDLKSTHGTTLGDQKLVPCQPVKWKAGVVATFGQVSETADRFTLAYGASGSQAAPGDPFDPDKVQETSLDASEIGEPSAKKARMMSGPVASMSAMMGPVDAAPSVSISGVLSGVTTAGAATNHASPTNGRGGGLFDDLPAATVEQAAPLKSMGKSEQKAVQASDVEKVIFLDVDGVLRPVHGREGIRARSTMVVDGAVIPLQGGGEARAGLDFWPRAMKSLQYIVQKTDARIVLSSDWRKDPVLLAGVKSSLREYDIPELVGKTPSLQDEAHHSAQVIGSFQERRCKEIRRWLRHTGTSVKRFCAIDDIDLSQVGSHLELDVHENFVKTDPGSGLTPALASLVVAHLEGRKVSQEDIDLANEAGAEVGA